VWFLQHFSGSKQLALDELLAGNSLNGTADEAMAALLMYGGLLPTPFVATDRIFCDRRKVQSG
jgi:hypothetical protein